MPAPMFEIRRVNRDGSWGPFLPDWQKIDWGDDLSDVGAVSIEYARNGRNADQFEEEKAEFALLVDGRDIFNGRFVYEEGDSSNVNEGQDTITVSCQTLVGQLKHACVFPVLFPAAGATSHTFTNQTPGVVLRSLFQRAKSRATVPWLAWTFNDGADSAGKVWAQRLTKTFDAGMTYLEVLNWLRDAGYIEYRMFGRQVRAYNPEGYGEDLTAVADPTVLKRGKHLLDSTTQTSTADLATRVLVVGDSNAYVSVVNKAMESYWGGGYEGFVSASGVTDTGTLTVIGNIELKRYAARRYASTYGIVLDDPKVQLLTTFRTGDWVYIDEGVGAPMVRYRVVKSALSVQDGQSPKAVVVLNDWFASRDVQLARKLATLVAG